MMRLEMRMKARGKAVTKKIMDKAVDGEKKEGEGGNIKERRDERRVKSINGAGERRKCAVGKERE